MSDCAELERQITEAINALAGIVAIGAKCESLGDYVSAAREHHQKHHDRERELYDELAQMRNERDRLRAAVERRP